MKTMPLAPHSPALALLVMLLALFAAGCAASVDSGPLLLRLTPDATTAEVEGYSTGTESASYIDDELSVTVRPLKGSGGDSGRAEHDVAARLLSLGHVVMEVEVGNTSESRVIYKPSYTALHSNAMDYGRALDFTDLYDIFGEDDTVSLTGASRRFFDLDVTLLPGARVKKLLVFHPLSEGATNIRVEFNDIYVGTQTRNVVFTFSATEEK